MKFLDLLAKELKEMLTPQTIIALVAVMLVLSFAGDALTVTIEDATEESSKIVICDQDKTDFTESVIALMKNPADGIYGNKQDFAYNPFLIKKAILIG